MHAQQRVGWQPSRFLADRGEAERAFQLAEQLGRARSYGRFDRWPVAQWQARLDLVPGLLLSDQERIATAHLMTGQLMIGGDAKDWRASAS